MYNRLNLWSRPFLINPSSHPLTAQGHLDPGSSYLPVSMQPSPAALMVLASSSSSSASSSSSSAVVVDEGVAAASRGEVPLPPSHVGRVSGRSSGSPETAARDPDGVVRHPRHPAFGAGPFPFFRPGEALQVPPFFSHLHQTLLRSHLDSAAAHLHQAVMDPRRMAASLYGLHSHHPSAFLATASSAAAAAAAKKAKYEGGGGFPLDDRRSSPGSTAAAVTNRQSSRGGHDLSTTGAQSSSSLRGAPWTPASSCSPPLADERRSSSAGGMSDADYDVISDHHGDAATSASSPIIVGRWSATGEGSIRLGGNLLLCPICRENLSTEDIQSHLIKELKELSQMSSEIVMNNHVSQKKSQQDFCRSSGFRSGRDMTSKSRYETFIRIRNNREGRLAKIRNRRKRLHDEMTSPMVQNHVTLVNGHGRSAGHTVQREGDDDLEETIDVIGFEEQDKEHQWICSTSPPSAATDAAIGSNNGSAGDAEAVAEASKKTEDKATKTDDVIVERITCSVCSLPYVSPLISRRCWHVFCQRCWVEALTDQSTCPQCTQPTDEADLQRVFM